MRFLSIILGLSLCFWLVSCDKSVNNKSESQAGKSMHASMPMQHLSMLLEHAISMMAQGAELKIHGNVHGDTMLAQSADLLRRAMSGPEMAAMHKAGQGQSSAMQHTHDLGAAAFDLLDMMMSMQAGNVPKDSEMLNHALNMAAQGASMKSLAVMGMSKDIDVVMQEHGLQMQKASMRLSKELEAMSAYDRAILKLIDILFYASSKR
ncbi:MAG: hypothetical protein JKY80_08270 [Mariprofundaceae bacterium]|nr:hypothetical protein [Mariprofundaceae bacterium]